MKTFFLTLTGAAALWSAGADDVWLRTPLAGGSVSGMRPSGHVEFRSRPSRGNDQSLHVEVEDVNLPAGTSLEVLVNGQPAGRLVVSPAPVRGGELELESRDGALVPALRPGDVVTVRSNTAVLLSGAIQTRPLDDVLRNPPSSSSSSSASSSSSSSSSTAAGDAARMQTRLAGGAISGLVPSGHIDFRQRGADLQLTVEVEDVNLPLGTRVDVEVDGRVIGQITISGVGRGGELELNTRDGALVQQIRAGAMVVVRAPGRGAVLTGVAQPAAPLSQDNSSVSSSTSSTASSSAPRLRSDLAGGSLSGQRPSGHIDFRTSGSDARLNVEVEDVNLPAGTLLDVEVDGRVVGQIRVDALRGGELELNSRDGAVVNQIRAGATVVVRAPGRGAILSGVAQARTIDTPPPSASSSSSSNSGGSNSSGSGNSGSGNSGSGNSGSGNSGSGNSGSGNSGSGNSGSGNSGSGNSGSGNSGSGNSGSGNSGSGNSGSGNSGSGNSGSGNSGSGNSGSGNSGSGNSGSGNSGSGNSGSGNSGSGNSGGGGHDDPAGHH